MELVAVRVFCHAVLYISSQSTSRFSLTLPTPPPPGDPDSVCNLFHGFGSGMRDNFFRVVVECSADTINVVGSSTA